MLDESARALRARGFISEATVEPGSYDAATNSVDVNVHIRDSWSLALDLKLNRSGGQTEWGIGLSDSNLLGTGKTLEIGYESEIDRDETLLGYSDGNVFGSRVQLSGCVRQHQRRPSAPARRRTAVFTRSTRAGRSAARFTTKSASTRCTTSAKRSTSSATTSTSLACRAAGRAASSSSGRIAGCSASRRRSTRSARRPTSPQPLLLPPDRKLVYPWIGWQWVEDDYREMTELNDMGRTEDISLGTNVFASVGFAKRRFGSDRDATLLRVRRRSGWEPGGPGRLLLLGGRRLDARRRRGLPQSAGLLRRAITTAAISATTCSP